MEYVEDDGAEGQLGDGVGRTIVEIGRTKRFVAQGSKVGSSIRPPKVNGVVPGEGGGCS